MPINEPCLTSNTEYHMEHPITNHVRVISPGYLDQLKLCCLVKPVMYNSYLIVCQVHILHGQHCQFVCSCRITPVLHVSCNSKQLRGGHNMWRGINDDLIRCLKGQCFILTQGQSIQGTVWGILKQRCTLQRSLHDLQTFQAPDIWPCRTILLIILHNSSQINLLKPSGLFMYHKV